MDISGWRNFININILLKENLIEIYKVDVV